MHEVSKLDLCLLNWLCSLYFVATISSVQWVIQGFEILWCCVRGGGGTSSWLGLLYVFLPLVLFVPLYLSFEFCYSAELGIF